MPTKPSDDRLTSKPVASATLVRNKLPNTQKARLRIEATDFQLARTKTTEILLASIALSEKFYVGHSWEYVGEHDYLFHLRDANDNIINKAILLHLPKDYWVFAAGNDRFWANICLVGTLTKRQTNKHGGKK